MRIFTFWGLEWAEGVRLRSEEAELEWPERRANYIF